MTRMNKQLIRCYRYIGLFDSDVQVVKNLSLFPIILHLGKFLFLKKYIMHPCLKNLLAQGTEVFKMSLAVGTERKLV